MNTAMTLCKPPATGLVLAQAVWDQFFEDALAKFDHPNPNLCCDRALDKTIRALGHRPRGSLTPEERADIEIRSQVEELIASASRPRGLREFEYFEDAMGRAADPEPFESLCDAALDESEVPC